MLTLWPLLLPLDAAPNHEVFTPSPVYILLVILSQKVSALVKVVQLESSLAASQLLSVSPLGSVFSFCYILCFRLDFATHSLLKIQHKSFVSSLPSSCFFQT
jgi:hypothetical protein